MSDFSLSLVLQIKTSKNHQWHGKGKHEIWENHSFWRNISREGAFFPFCGSGYRQSSGASVHIVRLSKREIVGSLSSVYFCGGDCVVEQDYTFKFLLVYLPCGYSHLIEPLGLKITNQTCSLRNHLLPIIYLLGSSSLHFYLQLQRKKLAVKEWNP